MTKTTTLLLPVKGPGQHIGSFSLAAGGPSLFTADRVWARKQSELGNTALYLVEYWGESSAIAHGGTTVVLESSTPGPKFELHPEAGFALSPPRVTLSGEELICGAPDLTQTDAATGAKYLLHGAGYSGVCRVLVIARHPVVYVSAQVKRLSKGPSGIPAALMIGFDGAVAQNKVTQFMDCRCRFDAGIHSATPIHDPETDRARSNAAHSPHPVAARPVLDV